MRILHIAPNAPYNDYWGYQDNLLPKYQRKLGHEVTLIATNTMHKDGKIVETDCTDYVLDDGVRVIRLCKKQYPSRILTNLNTRLKGISAYLNEIKPDFVFFHGLVSTTILDVIRYQKNNHCVIVQDNHLDYNNGMGYVTWKDKLVQVFFRHLNRKSIPHVAKVYGVTPWRKMYAEEYFQIPNDKTDVLIMGADDEKIDFQNRSRIREEIRKQYGVRENDFFIVTGGKIDSKKKILDLMEACVEKSEVKLLIFGLLQDDIQKEFQRLNAKNENIIYIGWLDSDRVYDYFFAADIVFFPGAHSVLWEQACAAKVPCVFKRWPGMEHVNHGGNSDFIDEVTVANISAKIDELHFTPKYQKMKEIALSEATDIYLYSRIAEKSLEMSCEYN